MSAPAIPALSVLENAELVTSEASQFVMYRLKRDNLVNTLLAMRRLCGRTPLEGESGQFPSTQSN